MFWDTLRADIRYTFRLAAAAPVFTGLAVLALALGISATSAIFTVVNAVLLRPLPYDNPDRLVMVWTDNSREGRSTYPLSPANFTDIAEAVRDLMALEAFQSFIARDRLVTPQGTEGLTTVSLGPQMLAVLGRQAMLGRPFAPDDRDVVVLSHAYWQRRFGADPEIIGRTLTIGSTPRLVIGVMPGDFVFPYQSMLGPDGFTGTSHVDVWIPLHLATDPFAYRDSGLVRNVHYLATIGRLREGVHHDTARAALETVARQLASDHPDANQGLGLRLVPLHEQAVGAIRPALLTLLAAVALVLLMASVNVANLLLARGLARQREFAVKVAIGAGRGRLVSQSLVEGLVLSIAGAGLALLAVHWVVLALVALAPPTLPRLQDVQPDAMVVVFTMVVALAVGLVVGAAPALATSQSRVQQLLQESGRGSAGPGGRRRTRSALVVAEVGLAVVLTVMAGLLLRSFVELLTVNPGFRPEGLLTLQVTLPDRLTTPEARLAFYDVLFERLEALPGVVAAGGTTRLPLGSTPVSTTVVPEGREMPPGGAPEVQFRRASHRYFAAMGIPVIRGRDFTIDDGPNAPPVVVINETMARQLFPGQDPVGTRIRTGPSPTATWLTIVGVIGDIHHTSLEDVPAPELYMPARQGPPVSPFLVVRTTGDPAQLAELVRADLRALDPTLTVLEMRTMLDVRAESMAERRFLLLLVSVFGLLALLLAAVGVYGVMAVVVGERTAEIGVRLALGARPGHVRTMVVGQALRLAGLGAAAGLVLALLLTPLLSSQLFGIQPHDPVILVVAPLVLVLTAVLAALLPATRAMKVNPIETLRA